MSLTTYIFIDFQKHSRNQPTPFWVCVCTAMQYSDYKPNDLQIHAILDSS